MNNEPEQLALDLPGTEAAFLGNTLIAFGRARTKDLQCRLAAVLIELHALHEQMPNLIAGADMDMAERYCEHCSKVLGAASDG